MFYYTTYRKDHSMISIELPHKLCMHLRREYFRSTTGSMSFASFLRYNISNAIVEGPLDSNFSYLLHFHEEASYLVYKIKWSEYVD